jgi:hypothetical protein
MKLQLILLFVLLSRGVMSAAAVSTLNSNELASARSQGSNSLATLKALITAANYNLLGFHSTNELSQATNAEPVVIYTAAQVQLGNYLPGQPYESLLDPVPRRVIIPIMVGPNVRSSATLRVQSGAPGPAQTWATANWGQPRLIRDLMRAYGIIPPGEVRSGSVPFAVELPVLDIWLVGYYNPQNAVVLRSTVDMRLGPITINRNEVVTTAAMHQLAIAAQRYNGLPN